MKEHIDEIERLKLYTIDENYSELIEEGGQWHRAVDVASLVEQRDRLWSQLFKLVEAVQKPGFESVLETAQVLPGCRAALAEKVSP